MMDTIPGCGEWNLCTCRFKNTYEYELRSPKTPVNSDYNCTL